MAVRIYGEGFVKQLLLSFLTLWFVSLSTLSAAQTQTDSENTQDSDQLAFSTLFVERIDEFDDTSKVSSKVFRWPSAWAPDSVTMEFFHHPPMEDIGILLRKTLHKPVCYDDTSVLNVIFMDGSKQTFLAIGPSHEQCVNVDTILELSFEIPIAHFSLSGVKKFRIQLRRHNVVQDAYIVDHSMKKLSEFMTTALSEFQLIIRGQMLVNQVIVQ